MRLGYLTVLAHKINFLVHKTLESVPASTGDHELKGPMSLLALETFVGLQTNIVFWNGSVLWLPSPKSSMDEISLNIDLMGRVFMIVRIWNE